MPVKEYTAWSVITSLIWEAILAVVVLDVLPRFGVHIPLWAFIVLMVVLGAYCAVSYWIGKRALRIEPLLSMRALIGRKCRTETPLNPRGYVRIQGELWQAISEMNIDAREEVVVEGVEGMMLLVRPSGRARSGREK